MKVKFTNLYKLAPNKKIFNKIKFFNKIQNLLEVKKLVILKIILKNT